jgi:hypothetical protein
MTKEELIRMAHKAGFLIDTHAQQYQPNCILSTHGLIDENLERFAALVVLAEREACETAVEDMARKYQQAHEVSAENVADACAYAIRARGEKA